MTLRSLLSATTLVLSLIFSWVSWSKTWFMACCDGDGKFWTRAHIKVYVHTVSLRFRTVQDCAIVTRVWASWSLLDYRIAVNGLAFCLWTARSRPESKARSTWRYVRCGFDFTYKLLYIKRNYTGNKLSRASTTTVLHT